MSLKPRRIVFTIRLLLLTIIISLPLAGIRRTSVRVFASPDERVMHCWQRQSQAIKTHL